MSVHDPVIARCVKRRDLLGLTDALKQLDIDPNERETDHPYCVEIGRTPLIIACENGLNSFIELLLKDRRTNVNLKDGYGFTALMGAVMRRRVTAIELLLGDTSRDGEERLDLNIRMNAGGQSALIIAIELRKLVNGRQVEDEDMAERIRTIRALIADPSRIHFEITGPREMRPEDDPLIVEQIGMEEGWKHVQMRSDNYPPLRALQIARLNGYTEIVQLLRESEKKGATHDPSLTRPMTREARLEA